MSQPPEASVRGTVAAAISNSAVRLLADYTGRGPTKAKTIVHRDVVLILLQDTMTKAEKTLIENGKTDLVLRTRHEFQMAMQKDLVAAVEMLVERKVIAFMSENHVDPDMAAEVFVLEPLAEPEAEVA
jgi:uncharacterized protein YbcI